MILLLLSGLFWQLWSQPSWTFVPPAKSRAFNGFHVQIVLASFTAASNALSLIRRDTKTTVLSLNDSGRDLKLLSKSCWTANWKRRMTEWMHFKSWRRISFIAMSSVQLQESFMLTKIRCLSSCRESSSEPSRCLSWSLVWSTKWSSWSWTSGVTTRLDWREWHCKCWPLVSSEKPTPSPNGGWKTERRFMLKFLFLLMANDNAWMTRSTGRNHQLSKKA